MLVLITVYKARSSPGDTVWTASQDERKSAGTEQWLEHAKVSVSKEVWRVLSCNLWFGKHWLRWFLGKLSHLGVWKRRLI